MWIPPGPTGTDRAEHVLFKFAGLVIGRVKPMWHDGEAIGDQAPASTGNVVGAIVEAVAIGKGCAGDRGEIMIASLSGRLIAEEWMLDELAPDVDAEAPDLSWFYGLAETRPRMYARMAPKVARLLAAMQVAQPADRRSYLHTFEIMRETLTRL